MDQVVQDAMDAAERSLSDDDREKLKDAIMEVASKKEYFTADDVWNESGLPETKGIGPLMKKAARKGVMTKHGYVPKKSAQGGRWQFTEWKSNIYGLR